MAIITREDGTDFSVYTYRELLTTKNVGLLKREVEMLSTDNGGYALFFTQDTGDIEAIFSHDPGYLLGECIWQHFHEPTDLIYCEQIPDRQNCLLVVIRNSVVFLDSEIPLDILVDELNTLTLGNSQYQIFLYGDLPITEEEDEEGFYAFDKSNIEKLTWLDEGVFPTLAVTEDYQLLPVEEAFAELGLTRSVFIKYGIGAATLVAAIYIGWMIFKPAPPPPPKPIRMPVVRKKPPPKKIEIPYEAYQQALKSASPAAQVEYMLSQYILASTIPGWTAQSLTYIAGQNNDDILVQVIQSTDTPGSLEMLLIWGKNNRIDINYTTSSAVFTIPMELIERTPPNKIYHLDLMTAKIIDRLKKVIENLNVSIEPEPGQKSFKKTLLTINFSSLSPGQILLLATQLQYLPIVLKETTFTISNGLISGRIVVRILGV